MFRFFYAWISLASVCSILGGFKLARLRFISYSLLAFSQRIIIRVVNMSFSRFRSSTSPTCISPRDSFRNIVQFPYLSRVPLQRSSSILQFICLFFTLPERSGGPSCTVFQKLHYMPAQDLVAGSAFFRLASDFSYVVERRIPGTRGPTHTTIHRTRFLSFPVAKNTVAAEKCPLDLGPAKIPTEVTFR
jgi:hypothetical protein